MSLKRVSPIGWLGIALVISIALLAAFGALNLAFDGGYYGMMETGAWGWAIAMMAVPVVVLVVVLLAALGGLRGPLPYAPSPTDALDLVDARYARGELGREEYLRIRADLSKGPSQPGGG